MRFFLALIAAKLSRFLSRLLAKGHGTSLPGLLALKIDPNFIKHFSRKINGQVIYIAGTNGKTTTTRLVSSMLRTSGYRYATNASSANLLSGVASSLANRTSITGQLKIDNVLFEVDEKALPAMMSQLPPTILLLTNLFRDQLDRYGEISTIIKTWARALSRSNKKTILIVNGNDPRLINLADRYTGPKKYFGTSKENILGEPNLVAADATRCPACGGTLDGSRFMAHLGILSCRDCRLKTPMLDADLIDYKAAGGAADVAIKTDKGVLKIQSKLFGRFNALNLTGAAAVGDSLNISASDIRNSLKKSPPAFGRSEKFSHNKTLFYLHLAKNPTGYNEILLAIKDQLKEQDSPHSTSFLLALNDNWADGQDISWIWDVDFENVSKQLSSVLVSGQRAGDLALRLKTAGINDINVETETWSAFEKISKKSLDSVHIIASYTAMIFLREQLSKSHLVSNNWES